MEKIFTRDLNFKIGHNLDAFNDLLRGNFGIHQYNEPITIKWLNYHKSKKDLGTNTILKIIEIIINCNESGHDIKLELY